MKELKFLYGLRAYIVVTLFNKCNNHMVHSMTIANRKESVAIQQRLYTIGSVKKSGPVTTVTQQAFYRLLVSRCFYEAELAERETLGC